MSGEAEAVTVPYAGAHVCVDAGDGASLFGGMVAGQAFFPEMPEIWCPVLFLIGPLDLNIKNQ